MSAIAQQPPRPLSPSSPRVAAALDGLAVAALIALPWSTSLTAISVFLWLLVFINSAELWLLRRHLSRPAVYAPLLLCALPLLGVLWSEAPRRDITDGLTDFAKLLLLPLVMVHFSVSRNGMRAIGAFLASCVILLLYSWASIRWPSLIWGKDLAVRMPGVPIKDHIYLSACFVLAGCGLIHVALSLFQSGRRQLAALCGLASLAFLLTTFYVSVSRTALIVLPVLLLIIGYQWLGRRGALVLLACFAVVGGGSLMASKNLTSRFTDFSEGSSSDQRLVLWDKSVDAMKQAPVLGHGTGYIRTALKPRPEEHGVAPAGISNPHNQIFAIGIQFGAVGVAILFFMWFAHAGLFIGHMGHTWPARLGLLVVVQSIVSSLFNSHLSDFTAGWLYVFGIGVLGGMMLQQYDDQARAAVAVASAPGAMSAQRS